MLTPRACARAYDRYFLVVKAPDPYAPHGHVFNDGPEAERARRVLRDAVRVDQRVRDVVVARPEVHRADLGEHELAVDLNPSDKVVLREAIVVEHLER